MSEKKDEYGNVFSQNIVDRDVSTRGLAARLWRDYIRGKLLPLMAAVFLMTIAAATTGAQVWLIEPAFDQMANPDGSFWLWAAPIGIALAACIGGLANLGQTVLMHRIGLGVMLRMQQELLDALLRADLQDIQNEGASKQLSRFITDMYLLRDMVIKAFTGIGRDVLKVAVLTGLMVYQNWQMSLAAIIFFPLSVYPIIRIGKRLRKISTNTQSEFGEMTAVVDDAVSGARQVKSYNRYAYEKERAKFRFDRIFRLTIKAATVRALSFPILDTLGGVTIAAVFIFGALQVRAGDASVGSLVSFITAVMMAYQPVRGLANLNATLQEGLAAARRVFDVIDYRPSIQDKPDAKTLGSVKGAVEINEVSFDYGDARVLNNVSIKALPGETVALVGPSGGGKSTLLNLIPRFYDVVSGQVLIDGVDIRDVKQESLRDAIAIVAQDTLLFNDTIYANIAYGRLDATQDDVEAAARAAAAHEFICNLPEGYHSLAGENGDNLSGGQRQRIAIARAVLKAAPILLLDEATSALDVESERQVQEALIRLGEGRTVFVIAHRLSTVVHADRIYVLDKGQVVESGTHDALMTEDGLYASFARNGFVNDPSYPKVKKGQENNKETLS